MSNNDRADSDRSNDAESDESLSDEVHTEPDRHDEDADHRADVHTDTGPNSGERGKWISVLIALLGVWMVGQAVVGDMAAAQFWNDILVGALLLGVGGYNYSQRASERFGNAAAAMIAVAVGLWLILAPFVLGADTGLTETTTEFALTNDVIVGLLAVALGVYSAYMAQDDPVDARRTTT